MLDRIYAIDPKAKNVLWQWGIKNVDIMHSIPKNMTTFFIPKTSSVETIFLRQAIDKYLYYNYPWIDTMGYLLVDEKELVNYQAYDKKGTRAAAVLLHATDGTVLPSGYGGHDINSLRQQLDALSGKKTAKPKKQPTNLGVAFVEAANPTVASYNFTFTTTYDHPLVFRQPVEEIGVEDATRPRTVRPVRELLNDEDPIPF
jgi:hypothetical protein